MQHIEMPELKLKVEYFNKNKRSKDLHTMDKVRNVFNIITIAFVSIDIFFRSKLPLIIHDNSWKIIAVLVTIIIILEILRRKGK